MSFRNTSDAAYARAEALQRELDQTEHELAQTEAELAAAHVQLTHQQQRKDSQAAAAQQLQQLANRAPAAERPSAGSKKREPTELERHYGAKSSSDYGRFLAGIGALAFCGALGGLMFALASPAAGTSVAVISIIGFIIAMVRWSPSATLKRARIKLHSDRQWVATRPYQLLNYPDAIGGLGGDALVLELEFSDAAPADLAQMVEGYGGHVIGQGYCSFNFGFGTSRMSDGHGGSQTMQTVEPMRARPTITRVDAALLSPLAQAYGLARVTAYIELSATIDEGDDDYEPLSQHLR